MTYSVYVNRSGDYFDQSEHETIEEACAAYLEVSKKWEGRRWYMVRIDNLDGVDEDNPDGLSSDEREMVEILTGGGV